MSSLLYAPDLPDHPHSPNRPLFILGGIGGGLLFGLFLALGIELVTQPLRGPGQVEGMGLPILGVVPPLGPTKPPRRFSLWPFRRKESLA